MTVRALTLGWHLHVVAPSMEALTEYDSEYDSDEEEDLEYQLETQAEIHMTEPLWY